jgi:GntR family transcriptional regulator
MNEARYTALARDLQVAIAAGRLPSGSLLPGEHELAETHSVSRGTVRAALDLLERDGVVERRRGTGTRVLPPRASVGFGQTVQSIDGLIRYAKGTRRVVSEVGDAVVDIHLAALLNVPPGSCWCRIRSLRVDDARPNQPICASEAYVAPTLAAVQDYLADEKTALCDLLSRHCGVRVESIDQVLQGALVPEDVAGHLRTAPGAPALQIVRRYQDASGWIFLVTVGLHPADRFAYRMQLERTQA